jgi:hypothetical protein
MENNTIEDFNKAFGQFSNAIQTNFKQIDELLNNSILNQSDRDKIIQASASMKEAIAKQDTSKIFESINTFQNDNTNK